MLIPDWRPDTSSPLPVYKQIEHYIRLKILHGEWPSGTRLPSQRTLSTLFGVNRSTVTTALGLLSASGLLEGNRGGGTVVRSGPQEPFNTTAEPIWVDAADEGIHYPNLPVIQTINRMEAASGIIRLGTGELSSELLPHDSYNRLLAELSQHSRRLSYPEPQGCPELREAIANQAAGSGILASAASVLIVSGSLQALHLISVGLLPKGTAILTEKPSYLYSIHAFQSAGMKLIGLPMDTEGLQTEKLSDTAAAYSASLLYTNPTFHNPTGRTMSLERRAELLDQARSCGLSIIEDGAYSELWIDQEPPPALKSLDTEGRVLYTGTLSKSFSPGLRIGWVIGPEPVIGRLADIKMQMDYGSSVLAQEAAALWLSSGRHEAHLQHVRSRLRERRDHLLDLLHLFFRDLAAWDKPSGGFYVWLKLTVTVPLRTLFESALASGILLNPGDIYDRQDRLHLRLSYAYASTAEMNNAVPALAGIVRKLAVGHQQS
ncbi:PLP-dependent aminotransferase family protein [Paenibacillus sp. P96]|uniref:PLP-dependent aminotransferase family protein n=1 Tax=Paenibacillus zeirhizosphaerae TaxID=2987519 RepID=A0ABT9FN12_9BACL|nr:PLP-dependent aminotransferase family protein [Paenibacillus sp. P96]MDP4096123.1 PLP-dependent aminotransferase family protein [Paenibacillus sp. P96]